MANESLKPFEALDFAAVPEVPRIGHKFLTLEKLEGKFPVPLLFVYAKQYLMVPPVVGEKIHQLVNQSEIIWLDEGSHFAHVDRPALFFNAIKSFLNIE